MLKIKHMRDLPRVGAALAPGRSRLALLETDKLRELDASNVEERVQADTTGTATSFQRHMQPVDVAPYGLFRVGGRHSQVHYEHSSRIWLAAGVTRLTAGDFDAYLVDGSQNNWQATTLSNVETGDLLDLHLLHTPFGAVASVGPRTKAFYPGLCSPRCLLNPLALDGSEYLISIAQSCTFSWLLTDGTRSRLLYSSHEYYAEAASLAHRLSMARREDIKQRDFQAAVAYIQENGSRYAPQPL